MVDNFRRDVLSHTMTGEKQVLLELACGHVVRHRIKNLKYPIPRRKTCDECMLFQD